MACMQYEKSSYEAYVLKSIAFSKPITTTTKYYFQCNTASVNKFNFRLFSAVLSANNENVERNDC